MSEKIKFNVSYSIESHGKLYISQLHNKEMRYSHFAKLMIFGIPCIVLLKSL